MASLAQLQLDVAAWLNRRDVDSLVPGWVRMAETDMAETLRARCMIVRGRQAIDNAFISLPSTFASMESIKDATSGKLLDLEDAFTGAPTTDELAKAKPQRSHAYRLVGNCVEFLPHPVIPDPPDPAWQPQQVLMAWYAKPIPLANPQDTNAILENHYQVYLFGALKYGAKYELDADRASQAEADFQAAVFAANLWKQTSDYSGAPLRAVVRGF